MSIREVTLGDRFDLDCGPVLMNGTQALVRLMLMQAARDRAAGLNTAGYVSGYRGSPLGAVDQQMAAAGAVLSAAGVRFQPGLNEDLAATAIWGTQQAELRGEGTHDGVFSLWYGKGPGVDRSGDAMRHANMAGTSPHGGVLMALGDDHTGESSTVCHQSDWALVDACMPVLSPAGVQEILDLGLYGYALSRFSGAWCGLKMTKDTAEVTSVVDGRADRMSFVTPEFAMPDGGLNIRLGDHWIDQEARLVDCKRFAAEAFSRANRVDRRVWGRPGARIGFVAAGKNWLDLNHAFSLLGIDAGEAGRLGLTTYKVGQTFPLDIKGFRDWAEGLDLIVVAEEKRKLIEVQVKEAIFDDRRGRRVYGWHKGGAGGMRREELFPTRFALDPAMIAERIGGILVEEGRSTDRIEAGLAALAAARARAAAPDIAARRPHFCPGCPHNTSTKVPDGSRAHAGIGCHFMALWMDRETSGYTHMGAEGANWIGEAPFSRRGHVFQNLGDGTYNHSGIMAIRAALAAGVNITYKILHNDAVAMTGGQANDGDLPPERVARELLAMGVRDVAVVFDAKEAPDRAAFPAGVGWHERAKLPEVQARMAGTEGVSAIIYVQACAAEKRRRRKRGAAPDPDRRVFINAEICEGCGDCGIQSNCVSVIPVETALGRKRAVDQSSCNKDHSCLAGFCPSFVTVAGGRPRRRAAADPGLGEMAAPRPPEIAGTHNVVIAGAGGTGVVTTGALLAMAAHLDGKAAGMMEMAGLAQKGGAVHVHCRIANSPEDIAAIRVAAGEAHTLIGADLVVSAGRETLQLVRPDRTAGVVNVHETVTGDFTRDPDFRIPGDRLRLSVEAAVKDGLACLDAFALAESTLGDSIYSNVILLGASWQHGQLPLSEAALLRAIELNGARVTENVRAFKIGRWAALNADKALRLSARGMARLPRTLEEMVDVRARHLAAYQSEGLALRYRGLVGRAGDPALQEAIAKGYHRVLACKDEFEVARLLAKTRAMAEEAFEGDLKLTFHLAPPFLPGRDASGRPRKRAFGALAERAWPLMARLKWLRGTPFNPFGHGAERRMERELIARYERDMAEVLADPHRNIEAAIALAEWPLEVRGFGPVKEASARRAAERRETLLRSFRCGTAMAVAAE